MSYPKDQTVLIPEATQFFDLFIKWENYSPSVYEKTTFKWEHSWQGSSISDYAQMDGECLKHGLSGYKGIRVIPSEKVIETIKENMLPIAYDSIYFSIINFPAEDYSTVWAKYSTILGQRLLAVIRTDSIPKMFRNQ